MNAQMHITDLELAKIKYLQVIDEKEREIAKLQKQLVDASSEKDDVHAALRAQLELYKADYEAEVGAKNSLMAEKNQLAEDLQNLQRRNQQLIEEVERLRRDGDFVHVPRPRTAEATSNDVSAFRHLVDIGKFLYQFVVDFLMVLGVVFAIIYWYLYYHECE